MPDSTFYARTNPCLIYTPSSKTITTLKHTFIASFYTSSGSLAQSTLWLEFVWLLDYILITGWAVNGEQVGGADQASTRVSYTLPLQVTYPRDCPISSILPLDGHELKKGLAVTDDLVPRGISFPPGNDGISCMIGPPLAKQSPAWHSGPANRVPGRNKKRKTNGVFAPKTLLATPFCICSALCFFTSGSLGWGYSLPWNSACQSFHLLRWT